MRRTLLGLTAVVATAAIACNTGQPPATQSPGASSGAPSSGASAAPPAGSSSAEPSAGTGEIDLFGAEYAPEDGTDGGQLLIGDWQEANQFNPFYVGQQTEANVASAVWASLVVFTHDYKYAPDLAADIPTTENGGVQAPGADGDAMHGSCVTAWPGRTASRSPATTSSTRGSGSSTRRTSAS
jgi:hypothetical protein